MPRYFYTLEDGERESDDAGTELPDDAAARRELVIFASEVLRDEPERLLDSGRLRLELHDGRGRVITTLDMTISN